MMRSNQIRCESRIGILVPRATITERKIGKITYQVVASHNKMATETAKLKIEKLIQRECARLNN